MVRAARRRTRRAVPAGRRARRRRRHGVLRHDDRQARPGDEPLPRDRPRSSGRTRRRAGPCCAPGARRRGAARPRRRSRTRLEPDGDGTRVQVVTDMQLSGPAAQFGRGVMQDVSGKLMRQFADCLAEELGVDGGARRARPPGPRPAAGPAAPAGDRATRTRASAGSRSAPPATRRSPRPPSAERRARRPGGGPRRPRAPLRGRARPRRRLPRRRRSSAPPRSRPSLAAAAAVAIAAEAAPVTAPLASASPCCATSTATCRRSRPCSPSSRPTRRTRS